MTYNGHKNWNHWNVSLWINNDEGLYNLAKYFLNRSNSLGKGRKVAAQMMMNHFKDEEIYKTWDGAPYSVSSIMAAMRDM
jgi:hypothetical protein